MWVIRIILLKNLSHYFFKITNLVLSLLNRFIKKYKKSSTILALKTPYSYV